MGRSLRCGPAGFGPNLDPAAERIRICGVPPPPGPLRPTRYSPKLPPCRSTPEILMLSQVTPGRLDARQSSAPIRSSKRPRRPQATVAEVTEPTEPHGNPVQAVADPAAHSKCGKSRPSPPRPHRPGATLCPPPKPRQMTTFRLPHRPTSPPPCSDDREMPIVNQPEHRARRAAPAPRKCFAVRQAAGSIR